MSRVGSTGRAGYSSRLVEIVSGAV
jgi:hypothetical protein